ncbi:MAG: ferrous iron transporter B [Clostridiales bacterium]|nr:ferrous iron transporter B [Clostridiales bacterium]
MLFFLSLGKSGFPALIGILTMFFAVHSGIVPALMLTGLVALGVFMTFLASWILSKTILKGMPSSFILELPPFRMPDPGKLVVRSVLDRTIFVLSRAVTVAAPAGAIIWLLANFYVGDQTLLMYFCQAMEPIGEWMGLDGVILVAFILGFPANEIVLPIMLMAYLSSSGLAEIGSLDSVKQILISHGWTGLTAFNTMLFFLFHWPCSTSCLTVWKETGSKKWTLAAFALPTLFGILLCVISRSVVGLFL